MGGGEYNNLGHYMVLNHNDESYKLDKVPEINPNVVICDDMLDDMKELSKYAKKVKQFSGQIVTITVNIMKNPRLKLLFCNNYRKMHGLPMRRKVRR